MQTIIVKLDSRKLKNPDLDILYDLPERIEQVTKEAVCDNGYDYLSHASLGIWLAAEDAEQGAALVWQLLQTETFSGNHLSETAEIYISGKENAALKDCRNIYP